MAAVCRIGRFSSEGLGSSSTNSTMLRDRTHRKLWGHSQGSGLLSPARSRMISRVPITTRAMRSKSKVAVVSELSW